MSGWESLPWWSIRVFKILCGTGRQEMAKQFCDVWSVHGTVDLVVWSLIWIIHILVLSNLACNVGHDKIASSSGNNQLNSSLLAHRSWCLMGTHMQEWSVIAARVAGKPVFAHVCKRRDFNPITIHATSSQFRVGSESLACSFLMANGKEAHLLLKLYLHSS